MEGRAAGVAVASAVVMRVRSMVEAGTAAVLVAAEAVMAVVAVVMAVAAMAAAAVVVVAVEAAMGAIVSTSNFD